MTGVTTEVLSEDFTGRLPISLVKAGHLSAGDNTVVQLAGSSHGAIMDSASTRGAKLTRNLEPCDFHFGAIYRSRTDDILIGNQKLYQLS